MITTRDLATLAGVSQSTVSRALRDRPEISLETRERIRNLAKQYGYIVRSGRHRTTATAERRTIAILTSDIVEMDAYLIALCNAISQFITQENYFPLLLIYKDEFLLSRTTELISTKQIDGFIIIKREFEEEVHRYLTELNIPQVYIHYFNRYALNAINLIDTDQYLGGYLATRHLLERGHRNILTLTSEGREFDDRTSGYFAAMRDAGLQANNDNVVCISRSYDDGYNFVMQNKDLIDRNTALFVQNDPGAIGCINALMDCSIHVPNDFSVIGFDGIEAGRYCRPQLTTVIQPFEDLARAALNHLLQRIGGTNDKAIRTFIQPTIVERYSTASIDKGIIV
ncbi:transcriptional regulator, LacI family [Priestia aryabhattai B8W22]|uniref:LacI family DNA-binding transcriptional regulator n=1 Tax=Priestia aryabhattai TaxID=412384 RepID=UPI00088F0252|nr:transcriptional regulator, LacI family [Priestia aryabhattai B8W22]